MAGPTPDRRRTVAVAVVGAIGLIALFGALVTFIVMSSQDNDIVEQAAYPVPPGMDTEGGIVIGQDGLPVTDAGEGTVPVLAVYSDVLCGHCVDFEHTNGADINAAREAGSVVVSYRVMPWMGTDYSLRVSTSLAAVAAGSPEHFVIYHDTLFANAYELAEIDPSYEDLAQIAVDLGVPESVASTFADETYGEWAMAVRDSVASDANFRGTPTVLLDGADVGSELGIDWTVQGNLAAALAGA